MERLPDDIPGRDILLEAGFTNYAVLKCHRSFESIRGMDPDTAREIKAYLGLIESQDHSTDYTVAELKDMDLSDKGEAFFEGDGRKSVEDLR